MRFLSKSTSYSQEFSLPLRETPDVEGVRGAARCQFFVFSPQRLLLSLLLSGVLAMVLLSASAKPIAAKSKSKSVYAIQAGPSRSESSAKAEVRRLIERGEEACYVKAKFETYEAARVHARSMRDSNVIDDFLVTEFDWPGEYRIADADGRETPDPVGPVNIRSTVRSFDSRNVNPSTAVAPANPPDRVLVPGDKLNLAPPAKTVPGSAPSLLAGVDSVPASASAIIPQKPSEPRIRLYPRDTIELILDETITSIIVINPELVRVELTGPRSIRRTDGKRTAVSDAQGHFSFSGVPPGTYTVSRVTNDLGMQLRATSRTQEIVSVSAKETESIDFGVTNFGFVSGRVFNDLLLAGESAASSSPGVRGVRVGLQSIEPGVGALTYVVDASGMYQFNNLTPGNYKLELDAQTLPPDFRSPKQTSWDVTVAPIRASYLDIPLAAQRAVSGIVFIDKDGDGQFDPQKDEAIEGARVIAGIDEVITGPGGSYILRNLPAGTVTISACIQVGRCSPPATIELSAEPTIRRGVNFSLSIRTSTALP